MSRQTGIALWASLAIGAALLAQPGLAEAAGSTKFNVVIRNISTANTLKLPGGKSAAAPIAPGVYAIVEGGTMLFQPGESAARPDLESLAEDGDAQALLEIVSKMPGVKNAGLFVPGQPFTVTAEPGQRLAFATMFVQSNDKFLAPEPAGISLFDSQEPVMGDLTKNVMLWDAGTEKDEAPGIGENQAPRQAKPNTGPSEDGMGKVRAADDGFSYPAVTDVIQLTILP